MGLLIVTFVASDMLIDIVLDIYLLFFQPFINFFCFIYVISRQAAYISFFSNKDGFPNFYLNEILLSFLALRLVKSISFEI